MTSRDVAVRTQSKAKVSKKQLPFLAVYRAFILLPENWEKMSIEVNTSSLFQNVSTLLHNKKLPEKTTAVLITVLSAIFSYLCSLYALGENIKLRHARSFYVLRRSCSFYRERAMTRVWRTRIRNLVSVGDTGIRMLRGLGNQILVDCKHLSFRYSKYLRFLQKAHIFSARKGLL